MRVLGHVPVPFGKKKAAPPPRVAAQRIAALALACAMMTGMALPAFAGTYDIANGSIDIHATENGNLISQWLWRTEEHTEYVSDSDGKPIENRPDSDTTITITDSNSGSGTSTRNTVTIEAEQGTTANVTLDHVEIDASSTGRAAVEVTGSGDTNIELNGNNTLTGDYYHAGLEHNKKTDANETSGKLTITDTDGNGSLHATGNWGGAGIGGGNLKDAGKIEITGGSITATGSLGGAGIGGGDSGGDADDITISGGTINAIGGTEPWGRPGVIGGAGIGGGGSGGNATVTITGGAVIENATGGGGCAGIGGGYASESYVTISGNATIEKATGGKKSAGIGGGGGKSTGTVTIQDNATIKNAQGGNGGAGIGGGQGLLYYDDDIKERIIDKSVGNVTIEGNAKIENAKSDYGGSGIGGGALGIGNVIIRGNAQIGNATGGEEGAGIGGGAGGLGDVDIEGKVTIQNAQGGIGAAGIGGGAESEPDDDGTGNKTGNKISIKGTEAGSPNITAKGGKASDDGLSGGAAIGSGSVYENDLQDPEEKEEKAPAAITIEGKATIDATAGGSIAIGDALTGEKKFDGLPVGTVITRKDSDGKDLTQEGDKPTEPEKPEPEKPEPEKPEPEKPEKPDPEKPDPEKPEPEKPSEPSGAVSTSAPAEELTASDAEYLVTVEGLSVTNALGKQITHSCTQNVQGEVLTIRVNSIVATAHLTMETLRTLKAQGVETIRFCTLLYRPTSVSIDALLNLGVDKADILWTHNGIQARLTVGGTDSSSLLQ